MKLKNRKVYIIALLVIFIFVGYKSIVYIQENAVKEYAPFEERRKSFDEVANLLVTMVEEHGKTYFTPIGNEGEFNYIDDTDLIWKNIRLNENLFSDITSFTSRTFDNIVASDKQVVFSYSEGEYLLVYSKEAKVKKRAFAEEHYKNGQNISMMTLGEGWYYFRSIMR